MSKMRTFTSIFNNFQPLIIVVKFSTVVDVCMSTGYVSNMLFFTFFSVLNFGNLKFKANIPICFNAFQYFVTIFVGNI